MPLLKALLAQLGSLALLWAIGRSGILAGLSPLALSISQGFIAATLSAGLGAPRWWSGIHLAFLPGIVLAMQSKLPPWVYLTAFVLLAATYWTSFRTQVPLFLSNRITVHRLAAFLPDTPTRFLDVGSGTGSMVRRLARLRPDWQIDGIENAPAPFFLSKLLARAQVNAALLRGDFWRYSLEPYDVVYAFLSPVPMPALWAKAAREMAPGSLLISNSFEIPGMEPERVIHIDDPRRTQLYCYRIGSGQAKQRKAAGSGGKSRLG
ncbi:class I SAM-dependent methyltransferase [Viridibacterium curvum]|uniref:Class I SAM-dependent methyltransferase n=1 Tax=Viridibacterium curvum TaxID=1101404 RepID=A0ABP9QXZ4_9RHOO